VRFILNKPDTFGTIASALCLIHCLATPLIFITQTCITNDACSATPSWWKNLDYLFLTASFIAIYKTSQTTSNDLIKPALWTSWISLSIIIINEKLNLIYLPKYSIYIVAVTLAVLHLYNLKFCQCTTKNCCAHEK